MKKYSDVVTNLDSETKIETVFQSTYGGNGLIVHLLLVPARRGSYTQKKPSLEPPLLSLYTLAAYHEKKGS